MNLQELMKEVILPILAFFGACVPANMVLYFVLRWCMNDLKLKNEKELVKYNNEMRIKYEKEHCDLLRREAYFDEEYHRYMG